ncbi:MAG: BspA family leucine-rich repeat surface protein [Spirochaetia bacterium]|nr:BspA family leucine-rich repeat surface protein [Spirochaetia bacterium]MDD7609526.1 BspA family leucine-rich repeat surface protein [Spirochaetales bacterium]MDY5913839.1 BspA family leucine-rich repeat surface protein [Treponema sp.]
MNSNSKCPNCQKEIRGNEKFCPNCGTRLVESNLSSSMKQTDSNNIQLILPEGSCFNGLSDAKEFYFVSTIPKDYSVNNSNWKKLDACDFMEGKEEELSDKSLLSAYIYGDYEKVYLYSPVTIYANKDSSWLFADFLNVEKISLSNFNTSKVENMKFMFSCMELKEIDLSHFRTDKVKDMSRMFANCRKLKKINLSSFNTSKVKTMEGMFSCCLELNNLNLSNFIIKKYVDIGMYMKVDMSFMFVDCVSLTDLVLPDSVSDNAEYDFMFSKEGFGECPYGNKVSWYNKNDNEKTIKYFMGIFPYYPK